MTACTLRTSLRTLRCALRSLCRITMKLSGVSPFTLCSQGEDRARFQQVVCTYYAYMLFSTLVLAAEVTPSGLSCSRRVVCALLWFVRPVSVCVCLCRGLCVGRCWPSAAYSLVCMGYMWWPWERTEPNANRSLYIGWLVQNRILGFVKKKQKKVNEI